MNKFSMPQRGYLFVEIKTKHFCAPYGATLVQHCQLALKDEGGTYGAVTLLADFL